MKTKVILISGKKQHGKNTVARMLTEFATIRGYNVVEVAFADPLKESAKLLFRLTDKQVYGTHEKEEMDGRWGLTPREILQKLGTEVGRAIHPDVWVRNLCYRIIEQKFDKTCPAPTMVLVTDCRFPNEIEVPRQILENVLTIRVNRPGMAPTAFDSHPSETALDSYNNFDYYVENDGDFASLRDVCKTIVDEIYLTLDKENV